MNILDKCNLTDEEANLAAVVIDLFGEGDHPSPTEESIFFFTPGYTLECLDQALGIQAPYRFLNEMKALKDKLDAHQAAWAASPAIA